MSQSTVVFSPTVYKKRFKSKVLTFQVDWPNGMHTVVNVVIAATAALNLVFSVSAPYLVVEAARSSLIEALSACAVGLYYSHLTHFDPLNVVQVVYPAHLLPDDILARWIYLPFLALISLLLSLPTYFESSFNEPYQRHLLSAGAELAHLLYIALLLAYPIEKAFLGHCLCMSDWQAIRDALSNLQWGFYVSLLVSIINFGANRTAGDMEPYNREETVHDGPERFRAGKDDTGRSESDDIAKPINGGDGSVTRQVDSEDLSRFRIRDQIE